MFIDKSEWSNGTNPLCLKAREYRVSNAVFA